MTIRTWDEDIKRLLDLKVKGTLTKNELNDVAKYYRVGKDDIIICIIANLITEMTLEEFKKLEKDMFEE